MVVKSEIKFIKSLRQKKYRVQNGLFVAEGVKLVGELLNSRFKAHKVYVSAADRMDMFGNNAVKVSSSELEKMSGLRSPNSVVGVFHIPPPEAPDKSKWMVALDAIQDPGNLGTIIRLCDWFGIGTLVCSPDTVDCYNPKVLQATMGSIARVNMVYTELLPFLMETPLPVYGTFMEGDSVYATNFDAPGILLMGNEAHGIRPGLDAGIGVKVSIPQLGGQSAESLNVAMAAAIVLSEIRRPTRK